MIRTAYPPSFSRDWKTATICWGGKPTLSKSVQMMLSYFPAEFWTYSEFNLKLATPLTPFIAQFLTPFLTTSSLKSQRVMLLASVHFPSATAAIPTPALKTKTYLSLNF
jgi:hypothetical protein